MLYIIFQLKNKSNTYPPEWTKKKKESDRMNKRMTKKKKGQFQTCYVWGYRTAKENCPADSQEWNSRTKVDYGLGLGCTHPGIN